MTYGNELDVFNYLQDDEIARESVDFSVLAFSLRDGGANLIAAQ